MMVRIYTREQYVEPYMLRAVDRMETVPQVGDMIQLFGDDEDHDYLVKERYFCLRDPARVIGKPSKWEVSLYCEAR